MARADQSLQRYFEGLRERGLYELAEGYCIDRLGDRRLSPRGRARLSVELARTYAHHATQVGPDEESTLWDKARKTLRDFVESYPRHPQRLPIELQLAMLDLAQGEANRWRWELVQHDPTLTEITREHLRRGIATLRRIRDTLSPAQHADRTDAVSAGRLGESEQRGLARNVEFQLARGLTELARTYSSKSPDRLDGLTQALRILEPLAGDARVDDITWSSRIDRAECYRLLGEPKKAERALDDVWRGRPPVDVFDRALAFRVRLLLDEGKVDAALAKVEDHRRVLSQPSGELDFLMAEALLHAWQLASKNGDSPGAQRYRDRLLRLVRQLHERGAAYWARRVEQLIARVVGQVDQLGDLELLVRAAETLYHSGRPLEAADRYDTASARARDTGQLDPAFDLGYTGAAILLDDKEYALAAERFLQLAQAYPSNERAAQAHLLAAFALGHVFSDEPNDANLSAYRAALHEHLSRFDDDETQGEVRWMLGLVEESQGRFSEAIEHLRRVPGTHNRASKAIEAAGRCYEALIAREKSDPRAVGRLVGQATGYFEQVLGDPEEEDRTTMSAGQLAAGVRLARLWISRDPPRYDEAQKLLDKLLAADDGAEAFEEPPSEHARWLQQARQVLVVALAGQGRSREAQQILEESNSDDARELLTMLVSVSEIAESAPEDARHELARLLLRVAERLQERRHRLDAEGQYRLEMATVRALTWTGDTRRALELLEKLTVYRPGDVALLQIRGELLLARGSSRDLRDALIVWRKLEKLVPARSKEWYTARYHLALTYFRLGNREQCRKLIGVTRLLHPEMGGPALRKQFEDLARSNEAGT